MQTPVLNWGNICLGEVIRSGISERKDTSFSTRVIYHSKGNLESSCFPISLGALGIIKLTEII